MADTMNTRITIAYAALEEALLAASADGGNGIVVWIAKADGRIHYQSPNGLVDEDPDLPEDIGDSGLYWQVPTSRDLDLGRGLVTRFVRDVIPGAAAEVAEIFRHRGAYTRYKSMLERRGLLQRWYDYENDATRDALLDWAEECGFLVSGATRTGGTR
jgi:hypothetical protein